MFDGNDMKRIIAEKVLEKAEDEKKDAVI